MSQIYTRKTEKSKKNPEFLGNKRDNNSSFSSIWVASKQYEYPLLRRSQGFMVVLLWNNNNNNIFN